jgi:hypothetical protein
MKNSILLFLLMLIASPAISQFNTFSPYTRYGLGDLTKGGFGQNLAMGGTGVALHQSNQINYLNPAAYCARDSMSVLFDFGLNSFMNQYETTEVKTTWGNGNFHHIALSVPIGKHFGMGTGLVPYSSVGYSIKQEYNDLGTGDPLDFYYHGDGGIMKYFLGFSGQLFNRVSFGVNMNYLLGDINRQRFLSFPSRADFATTTALEDIQISHTYFGFGLQYKEVIADKFFFTLGGTYDLQTTFNSAIDNSVTSLFPGTTERINDSTYIYPEIQISGSDTVPGIITIPSKIGLGIAFGIPEKLTITADYYMQDWAATSSMNDFLESDGFKFANTTSMHFGIEYTPDHEALRGYHKQMSYRVGGYMSDHYVSMKDYQMKDYGITFGVGLPMNKSKSSFNVAFTLGSRGTTEYNLVKENYGILTFSVTLHDLWFYKRKFD